VIKNPRAGFVEPDDVPFDAILPIITPYIEPMAQEFTDWTPLPNNEMRDDCWILKNALTDAK
jgi:homospermidine synthase